MPLLHISKFEPIQKGLEETGTSNVMIPKWIGVLPTCDLSFSEYGNSWS